MGHRKIVEHTLTGVFLIGGDLMGNVSILDSLMEEKLMNMHTAFVGRIISVSGDTATVQPLNKVKQYGKAAQAQAVITDVPILYNARYKLKPYTLKYEGGGDTVKELKTVERVDLKSGDIVFCVCADRDISETRNGSMVTPSVGRHHNQSDCVIVGCL